MADNDPKSGPQSPPDKTLEILQAIRESASFRWEKRRDYEWKLSFGIWTALAAFVAIVLDRGIHLDATVSHISIAIAICAAIIIAHIIYLIGIIKHTLVDVKKQYWAEQTLEQMLAAQPHAFQYSRWDDDLKATRLHKNAFWPKVGIMQAAITFLLCVAINLVLFAPRLTK